MAATEESEDSCPQETGRLTKLRQDELIEKLVRLPAPPPDVILLGGLVGNSTRPGHLRLYLTPLLNHYIEFLEDDVLYHQPVPPALNPLGGTLLWVRREANLLHTRTASQQVQAQFLQGSITNKFLPKAGIENLDESYPGYTTQYCNITIQ